MRMLKIQVNGKEYQVEVDDPNVSPAIVRVNGQVFEVTVSEQRAGAQSIQSPAEETDLEELYVPTVATTYVETAVEPDEEAVSAPRTAPAADGELYQVTAPMPGKVLDIAVQVGAQVSQGDTMCNLEAMKMKSPIRATSDGTVVEVLISEGQNVNFGDILFMIQ